MRGLACSRRRRSSRRCRRRSRSTPSLAVDARRTTPASTSRPAGDRDLDRRGRRVPSRRGVWLALGALAIVGVIVVAIVRRCRRARTARADRRRRVPTPMRRVAADAAVDRRDPTDAAVAAGRARSWSPTRARHADGPADSRARPSRQHRRSAAPKPRAHATSAQASSRRPTPRYLLDPQNVRGRCSCSPMALIADGDLDHGCKYLRELALATRYAPAAAAHPRAAPRD